MKWINKIVQRMKDLVKKEAPVIYAVDTWFLSQNGYKNFQMKFTDKANAEQWMQKVISRFEGHKDFPLKMIFLCIYNDENKPLEVLENDFFNETACGN